MPLWAFLVRIWAHCRSRKAAAGVILAACLLETALFWVVPVSFRSLVDNVLGPRDRQRLALVLAALSVAVVVAALVSIQRGRLYAHLQSQIVSDIRFLIFHKVQRLPVSYFNTVPAADVLARASGDLAALEAALVMSVTWGLMPALDAVTGTAVLFALDWRLALIASLCGPGAPSSRPDWHPRPRARATSAAGVRRSHLTPSIRRYPVTAS